MAPQQVKSVIAVCLVMGAVVGAPWDVSGANQTLASGERLDAPPASKSCGDFQVPGPARYPPINLEVVQGNVPCRVARRVMKDQYGEGGYRAQTGFWSCGWPETGFIRECEKSEGGEATIRTRFYCRDWGADRSVCLDRFGPP